MQAIDVVKEYYQHFNNQNWPGMLSLLDSNIRHETNQGDVRVGLELFKEFQAHMDKCYEENLTEMVFMDEPSGTRVSVEFVVNGVYKGTDEGLPEAKGQKYVLPAGAFLAVENGKITRVTTYYNLPLWIKLVSA